MKRTITLSFIAFSSLCAFAQNEDKTIALDEVVVKAAKVVNQIDGQTIYPSDAQKESSSNGYALLQRMSLPNIRIDGSGLSYRLKHTENVYTEKGKA